MITRKQYPNHRIYEMEIGGRTFTVETGKVADFVVCTDGYQNKRVFLAGQEI